MAMAIPEVTMDPELDEDYLRTWLFGHHANGPGSTFHEKSSKYRDHPTTPHQVWRKVLKIYAKHETEFYGDSVRPGSGSGPGLDVRTVNYKIRKSYPTHHNPYRTFMTLSHRDDAYVKEKYLKYLFELWITQLPAHFEDHMNRQRRMSDEQLEIKNIFSNLISQLLIIKSLSEVPPWFHSKKFQIILHLIDGGLEDHPGLKFSFERVAVRELRRVGGNLILQNCQTLIIELAFLSTLQTFLSSPTHMCPFSVKKAIAPQNLEVTPPLPPVAGGGNVVVKKFLKNFYQLCDKNNFLNDPKIDVLKIPQLSELVTIAVDIEDVIPSPFFMVKYNQLVETHCRGTKYEEIGTTLKVTGSSISVAEVNSKVQSLQSTAIDGVHLVATVEIQLDEDLTGDFWRGKNLLIYTNQLYVGQQQDFEHETTITLDLSGRGGAPAPFFDQKPATPDNLGTDGISGGDGEPGESGGNVMIIANYIHNPQKLTIISLGGDGGHGQGGGDGSNGPNGEDGGGLCRMTKDKFKKLFPYFSTAQAVDLAIKNFEQESTHQWSIVDKKMDCCLDKKKGCRYYHLRSSWGTELIFSYLESQTRKSMYAKYTGTQGGVGGAPGFGGWKGRGGSRGEGGEIKIFSPTAKDQVIKIFGGGNPGKDGLPGNDGRRGEAGKNENHFGFTAFKSKVLIKKKIQYYEAPTLFLTEITFRFSVYDESMWLAALGLPFLSVSDWIYCHERKQNVVFLEGTIDDPGGVIQEAPTQIMRRDPKKQNPAVSSSARKSPFSRNDIQTTYAYLMERSTDMEDEISSTFRTMEDEIQQVCDLAQALATEKDEQVRQDSSQHHHIVSPSIPHPMTTDRGGRDGKKKIKDPLLSSQFAMDQREPAVEESSVSKIMSMRRHIYDKLEELALKWNEWYDCVEEKNKFQAIPLPFRTVYTFDRQYHQKLRGVLSTQSGGKGVGVTSCDFQSAWHVIFGNKDHTTQLYHCSPSKIISLKSQMRSRCLQIMQKNLSNFRGDPHNQTYGESFKMAYKKAILNCHGSWDNLRDEGDQESVKLAQFYQTKDDRLLMMDGGEILEKYLDLIFSIEVTPDDLAVISIVLGVTIFYFELNERGGWPQLTTKFEPHLHQGPEEDQHPNNDTQLSVDLLYDPNQGHYISPKKYRIRDRYAEAMGLYGGTLRCIKTFFKNSTNLEEVDNLFEKIGKTRLLIHGQNLVQPSQNESHRHPLELSRPAVPMTELDRGELIEKILNLFSKPGADPEPGPLEKVIRLRQHLFVLYNTRILDSLLSRWDTQGFLLKWEELTLFFIGVNGYLADCGGLDKKSSIESHALVDWLINANPQIRWLDEIYLLKLERLLTHFPLKRLNEWRKMMEKIETKIVLALILEKLEDSDKNQISATLEKIPQAAHEKFEMVEKILQNLAALGSILQENLDTMSNLPLVYWLDYLETARLAHDFESIFQGHQNDQQDADTLQLATYYLLSIQNVSKSFVNHFINFLTSLTPTLPQCQLTEVEFESVGKMTVKFLAHIYYNRMSPDDPHLLSSLEGFQNLDDFQKFIDTNIGSSPPLYTSNEPQVPRGLDEIVENIERDGNSVLPPGAVETVKNIVRAIPQRSPDTRADLQKSIDHLLGRIQRDSTKVQVEVVIGAIDDVICFLHNFRLRDTQKLTIALFTLNPTMDSTTGLDQNLLAQVSTGEGKSFIVAATCIVKYVLEGEASDVITSSPILAIRDANEMEPIFNFFHITVGHNSSDNSEDRKMAYKSHVVYGETGNFERDYLLSKYEDKNITGVRGDLSKINVIIDEVDCLLLDNGNNVLYLSHQPPGLDAVESVLLHVWELLVHKMGDGILPSVEEIRTAILLDMWPTLRLDQVQKISPSFAHLIMDDLESQGVIDSKGKILKNISWILKKFQINPNLHQFEQTTIYTISNILDQPRLLHVPRYLEQFVEMHLDSWIESGLRALWMTERREYVVDRTDRTYRSNDPHLKIIIIDPETGVDQTQSRWSEALHQFLELKHGCKMSPLSLKAIFISNISYFKKYKKLLGLTGTLGSRIEREFLKNVYNAHYVTIPPALPKNFFEELPIICSTSEGWRDEIIKKVDQITGPGRGQRSILIICNSVKSVEYLHDGLIQHHPTIHVYKRSYEEFTVGSVSAGHPQGLNKGTIILATNLAGRGTDIVISDELNKNGGLFVCLTYLSENIRVEQQAFGRTSRKGQNGSGQLIIQDPCLLSSFSSGVLRGSSEVAMRIVEMKRERDGLEKMRVAEIKNYFDKIITKEEQLFDLFSLALRDLSGVKRSKKNKKAQSMAMEEGQILVLSYLDEWAFLLDRIGVELIPKNKFEHATTLVHQLIQKIYAAIEVTNGRPKGRDSPFTHLSMDPGHLTRLGVIYLKQKKLRQAQTCFQKVIQSEPDFCAGAMYYQSLVLLKMNPKQGQGDNETSQFFVCLHGAKKLFKNLVHRRLVNVTTLEKINVILSKSNLASRSIENAAARSVITQDNSFRQQQENFVSLYNIFLNSIQQILGQDVHPENLVSPQIASRHQPFLYNFLQEFYPTKNKKKATGVLTKMKKCVHVTRSDLTPFCSQYGVTLDALEKSLNSLDQRQAKLTLDLPSREGFFFEFFKAGCMGSTKKYFLRPNSDQEIELGVEERSVFDSLIAAEIMSGPVTRIDLKNAILVQGTIDQHHLTFSSSQGITTCGHKVLTTDFNVPKILSKYFVTLSELRGGYEDAVLSKFYFMDKTLFNFTHLRTKGLLTQFQDKIFNFLVSKGVLSEDRILAKNFKQIVSSLDWGDLTLFKEDIFAMLIRNCVYRVAQLEVGEKRREKIKNAVNDTPPILDPQLDVPIIGVSTIASMPEKSIFYQLLNADIIQFPKMTLTGDQCSKILSKIRQFPFSKEIQNFSATHDMDYLHVARILEAGNFNFDMTLKGLSSPDLAPHHREELKDLMTYLEVRLSLKGEKLRTEIVEELSKYLSPLKTVETPDGHLKPIEDFLGPNEGADRIQKLNELIILKANGWDSIFTIGEKLWSTKILWRATICLIAGIIQFTVGLVIEFYSVGWGTFVASAFMSEGIGDISYALHSFYTGQFSMKDYWAHKWKSMTISVIGGAVGALYARAVAVSRYGMEIVGTTGNLSKVAGSELIEQVGFQRLMPIIARRVGGELIQNAAVCGVNFMVNEAIQKFVRDYCHKASELAVLGVTDKVEKLDIHDTLYRLVEVRGVRDSQIIVDQVYRDMERKVIEPKYIQILQCLKDSVTKGIAASDVKKVFGSTGKTSPSAIDTAINVLGHVMTMKALLETMNRVWSETDRFCKDYSTRLKTKVTLIEAAVGEVEAMEAMATMMVTNDEFQKFHDDLKQTLVTKVKGSISRILEQQFVSPILNLAAFQFLNWTTTRLQRKFNQRGNEKIRKKFEKARHDYEDSLRMESGRKENETLVAFQERQGEKFHHQLVGCMKYCTDVKLYAEMVRAGAPMSIVEVTATANILGETIKIEGADGTNFPTEVHPVTSTTRTGTAPPLHKTTRVVLKDHKFSMDQGHMTVDSDSFLRSLGIQDVTAFRDQIVFDICTNSDIRQMITRRHHQFYFDKECYSWTPSCEVQDDDRVEQPQTCPPPEDGGRGFCPAGQHFRIVRPRTRV